ncbi:MAG: ribosome biogenesis GTP-binding protein YihA/YsxC [Eubacteriaceae bacterium]|nr:ribosome biogenesis GTP-binding protein YihA/YsxC [Eubacteriaceae bacterium]
MATANAQVKSVELVATETSLARFPAPDLVEVVLIGKSNVGKSSFINAIVNRKRLAHTSNTPGKTRTANFYLINNDFYLVDMPGYGYAKVSKQHRAELAGIISDYVKKRKADFIVYFLFDCRHLPTKNDLSALEFIEGQDIYPIIVFTKTDKLKATQKQELLEERYEALGRPGGEGIILFSKNSPQLIQEARNFTFGIVEEAKQQ